MVQLPDLPTEILDKILLNIGPFDDDKLKEIKDAVKSFDDYRASLKSLAGLCRTCKALRRVAQPILYRYPLAYDDSFVSLVRTLATREDLKERVQGLVIKFAPDDKEKQKLVISPDDQVLFNNLIAKYPTRANGESIDIPSTWATGEEKTTEVEEDPKPGFSDNPKLILAALLLTQIPNVERISMDMGSNTDFPFCQTGSMPRLVELNVHYEGKFCLNLMVLDGVLKAAPALKTLNTVNVYLQKESKGIPHDNLTSLELIDAALEWGSFKTIIQGFPKLERFSLQPSHSCVLSHNTRLSAYQILVTLPIRADTLRHIHLLIHPMEWEGGLYDAPIPSLKGMTLLETLYVDYANLWPDKAKTGLVEFLPPSIRIYEQDYCHPELIPVMRALARNAPEKFPNLKKVTFGKFYEDDEDGSPTTTPRLISWTAAQLRDLHWHVYHVEISTYDVMP
ncbi:hypothetical protein CEP54_005404 [Fusarium duplospermum]|uniref:Uncharacterized protein n=1 Tax=Fusarium duplospermum TaxID=1325734 RepID=A0A428QCW1_9HYPO|nr:hypothetical protein CEP54_005404 [Fusarium duplospermum]